jgi:hypothetical protein
VEGDQEGSQFGKSVASAGDINGDGFSDLVIGAPFYANGQTDEGRIYLYMGSATGLGTTPVTRESNQVGARFGYSVSSAGDVNGDGFSDLLVGAPSYESSPALLDEGAVFLYLGSAAGLASSSTRLLTGVAGANFGTAVVGAGDLNGDGFSDVAVGADLYQSGEVNEGAVYIFHGSSSGLPSVPAWIGQSNTVNAKLGGALAPGGDVNSDGYADLLVGAVGDRFQNGVARGSVRLYLGSPGGLTDASMQTIAPDDGAYFGFALGGGCDLNGDGYADIVVGDPFAYVNGVAYSGRALVYYGEPLGVAQTPSWLNYSDQTGVLYGYGVACGGDVNGDGMSELLVGAPGYDNGQVNEGRLYVYPGAPSGLGTLRHTATTNEPGAHLGCVFPANVRWTFEGLATWRSQALVPG